MNELNHVEPADNIITLMKQMEGVEQNAHTMRLLSTVYGMIAKDHPEGGMQFVTTMSFMEEIRGTAWENLVAMQDLPEDEQHFLFNGELSAQEAFVRIVTKAFGDITLNDETRPAYIQAEAEEHALNAEAGVAEPLAQLRMIAELASALTDGEGETLH